MIIFRQFKWFSIENRIENRKIIIKNDSRYIFYPFYFTKNTRTDVFNNCAQRVELLKKERQNFKSSPLFFKL